MVSNLHASGVLTTGVRPAPGKKEVLLRDAFGQHSYPDPMEEGFLNPRGSEVLAPVCLSRCLIIVKRHHDRGHAYKRKHFPGGWPTVLEV